jgi:hypothetical protein
VKANGRGAVETRLELVDPPNERQAEMDRQYLKRANPFRDEDLSEGARPPGTAILLLAAVLAVLAVVALVLMVPSAPPPSLAQARNVVLLALLAGLIVLFLWQLGWLIKIVFLNKHVLDELREKQGGFSGEMLAKVTPGNGLYFGLGASVLAAFCVNVTVRHTMNRHWAYVTHGVGLLLGVLVVVILARPWDVDDLVRSLLK